MKSIILSIVLAVSINLLPHTAPAQQDTSYEALVEAFRNPPLEAKPKVYWWCLNGNIDTVRAKQEFRAMKEAGITGFDLFEIGVPPQDTMIPGGPAFMSDESVQTIKWAVDEAGKLGLTVGLNLASSWNAGGSWVKPEHGGKSLYVSTIRISRDSGDKKIVLPFPEISFPKESLIGGTDQPMIPYRDNGRPEYYEDIAVLALPVHSVKSKLDTADIINVTSFFNPETDELSWNPPPGEWNIRRYVSSNSGQQIVLPSPHSAGLTIDHFDSTAVETHLMYIINRLKPALGDFRNTALKTFYLASYEARGLVWTPTLPEEFRKITGYEVYKFLPALIDPDIFDPETTRIFQTHFKKTLSELMIHNLYRKAREICHRYGLKINSEAGGPGYPLYNGPAEPLKAQGSLDIPRGEFWINHARYYKDGNDSIDVLRVVKEASAASHIYQKHFVEEEAFTSFQHWQEGPFNMKPWGDRAFCEGMNRVVFHGFSHNITGAGFPGYVYHAGTHFNDKRAWWPHAKPFIDYLARISAVFQESDFKADVLWHYGDKVPNSATPKNTHFKVGAGYDYEVVNTDVLIHNLFVKNGKLVLGNGAEFELLALEDEDAIHPGVLQKLRELAGQGAIIIGEKPQKVKQLAGYNISDRDGQKMINELWAKADELSQAALRKSGKIYSGIKANGILQILNVPPDLEYHDKTSGLLDYIHFNKNEVDVYFIRNTTGEWLSRNVRFRQQSKVPEIWDPISGEIIPVPVFDTVGAYVNLPISLPPYGSTLIIFKKSSDTARFTAVSDGHDANPPLMEYTRDGIYFPEEGVFQLKNKDNSVTVENKVYEFSINGPWEVSFTPGWGAPDKVVFPELISWTESGDEGVKYYSGIARYETTFPYNAIENSVKDKKIYLDLGEISKTGEVWLNGHHLGIAWKKPYRFDVTGLLNESDNTLIVEVANTWSNRLKGDAVTRAHYTNTNIRRTIVPAPPFVNGDQTRVPWGDVPLIESGLLGPVMIRVIPVIGLK